MGAYYQTQIKNKEGKIYTFHGEYENHFSEKGRYTFLKFLEHNLFANYQKIAVYLWLMLNENEKFIVNEICDYDEDEKWFSDYEELQEEKPVLPSREENSVYFDLVKYMIENHITPKVDGIIINEGRKEYIDLSYFLSEAEKNKKNYLIDPLALLTRKNKEKQGGGDFHFSAPVEDGCKEYYKVNKNYEPELVASWFNSEIHLISEYEFDKKENKEKYRSFKNISRKILVFEKW